MQRTDNQDAYGQFPAGDLDPNGKNGQLFLLADGMGGHVGGSEASRMAVRIIGRAYELELGRSVDERLRRAFAVANRMIFERSAEDEELSGMGTTCTALAIKDGSPWVAHVGDSRAYRVTAQGVEQVTRDHTRVEDLLALNMLTPEEAASHPNRNVLSRALGVRADVDVDIAQLPPLHSDEVFVLCSDGLADVSTEELHDIVLSKEPQEACDYLIKLANERGGRDNVTVQVVRIGNGRSAQKEKEKKFINWSALINWSGLLLLIILLTLAAIAVGT